MTAPETPQIYGGRFRVERVAGRGGMATIYRARDLMVGDVVALKVLDGQGALLTDRFQQEVTLLAQLRHPAIVRYIEHGVAPSGQHYLAMEWLEGHTLEERLAAGPLGLLLTVRLGVRVLEALAFAHEQGVVHRDLKPSNLFLPGGSLSEVKLLDFGIARRIDARRLTKTGLTIGTPMYMSPEQARGDRAFDPRSDFFSLAAILLECITGVAPFAADTQLAMMMKICLDQPDVRAACGDAPQQLVDVLTRMLGKRPDDRPARASALLQEFSKITQLLATTELAPSEETVALPPRTPRPVLTSEQRVLSAIVLWQPNTTGDVQDDAAYLATTGTLADMGARIDRFVGGAVLITLLGRGTPSDQAIAAARCALALQARLPEAVFAVSTGRGQVGDDLPVGEVIDRAAILLEGKAPGTIVVDRVTRALIGDAFEVRAEGETAHLLFERTDAEPARTLLGNELPCLGRERELGTLLAIQGECFSEPVARTVLVTAPAGAGKSRVRREFLQRATRDGQTFQLLLGRGDAIRSGAPFGLLGPALRAAAGITGGEPPAVQRQRFLAWVGRHLPPAVAPRTAAFLGEMAGVRFPDDHLPALRAAREDPRVMADQMLVSWLDWIEAACSAGPMMLVLEDLHWGDVPTVEFVDAALRTLHDRPLMVVALSRPEVEEKFPQLWAERNLQRISLPPLTPKSCHKLIQQALPDLAAARAAWIVERADGNPFYLEELLQAVARDPGALTLASMPDTVLGMVQARFDALGAYVRKVLRAASVFGQTFCVEGVTALVEEVESVAPGLDVLRAREVILPRPGAGPGEFVFRHALLRDAAYELLTDQDRQLAHGLAGEYLERRGERDAVVLVEHFERGGLAARAALHSERAAAQALEANDLRGVIERVERGVRNGVQGEALGGLRLTEAQACMWMGEFGHAEAAAREAADLTHGAVRLHAVSELVAALAQQGHYDETEAVLAASREWPEAREHPAAWHQVLARAACYLPSAGRRELTEKLLEEVERGPQANHPVLAALCHNARGLMMLAAQPGRAAFHFQQCVTLWESCSDLRRTMEARGNLAAALGTVGKLEETERHLRELLAGTERMNLQSLTPIMMENLGIVRADLGALDEARALVERALGAACRQGDQRMEGRCHHALAVIETRAGRFEAAEAHARAAVANAVTSILPLALAGLAGALRGQGRLDDALAQAREADRLLEAQGYVEDSEALVRLSLVECLLATGDELGAREASLRAYRRLLERAGAMHEPEWRTIFLTSLPDHRRTIEVAESLGLA